MEKKYATRREAKMDVQTLHVCETSVAYY
uniref:Uncharacterized protein n=1 Tax=Arundo donax TaxID=35708 RepID=A0A0A9H8F8_ARUDO